MGRLRKQPACRSYLRARGPMIQHIGLKDGLNGGVDIRADTRNEKSLLDGNLLKNIER